MNDPRYSFLCVAHSHFKQMRDGHEPIDYAFGCVTRLFDHMFPPAAPECPTCGCAPCQLPTFCAACRADQKKRWRR